MQTPRPGCATCTTTSVATAAGRPFDSAWCLVCEVCEVCRLTVDCVDCRYFLYFVFLGDARRSELSPCNAPAAGPLVPQRPHPLSTASSMRHTRPQRHNQGYRTISRHLHTALRNVPFLRSTPRSRGGCVTYACIRICHSQLADCAIRPSHTSGHSQPLAFSTAPVKVLFGFG